MKDDVYPEQERWPFRYYRAHATSERAWMEGSDDLVVWTEVKDEDSPYELSWP